jgi:hypothetical protein
VQLLGKCVSAIALIVSVGLGAAVVWPQPVRGAAGQQPPLVAVSTVPNHTSGQPEAKAAARPQTATKPALPPKREMIQVTVVKVKPDLLNEWLEFQKNETIPMLKKAGATRRDAWQTGIFGESGMYAFVAPIENFNQYDGDNPPLRALGADGARAYAEKNRRFIVSSHTYADQTRPDLGYELKMSGPPKLALLSNIQIALGKGSDYEALIKSDVLPVMRKARLGYAVSQTVLGGDINEFTTLIFYDTFADIGKGHPFDRILGADGSRQLTAKAVGIVTHVERSIVRYVPELSFAPRPIT